MTLPRRPLLPARRVPGRVLYLAGALLLLLLGPPGCARTAPASPGDLAGAAGEQRARLFEARVTRRLSGRYLLHLPAEYGRDPDRRWPLILYLHGGSRRGEEIDSVRTWGLPRMVEEHPSFPFVVVSPQAEAGTLWTDTEHLLALLDRVIAEHAVDRTRVYLTGHSMGGNGAWYLAYRHPERFAAVAPMSGPANAWWAGRLRDTPLWVFHGAQDDVVPSRESAEMVEALRRAGSTRVRFTLLPERGHGLLDLYEDPDAELYRWFLEHRLPDAPGAR